MAGPETPPDLALKERKARDGALILPMVGLLFLTPPVANMFAVDGLIFGIPVLVAYIFTVWGILILCARALARRLADAQLEESRRRQSRGGSHVDEVGP
ncbi:MAG: hypothetical protein AAF317_05200 [Pseudomonadota bacterium]